MEDRRSMPPYEDEFSRALLRSADGDEPSAAACSKVAAALGVSAAGIAASVPAQAALGSNGLSAASFARFSGSLFGKAVIGVSSVLVVAGGVALLRAREHAAVAAHKSAESALVLARASAPNITPEPAAQTTPNGPSEAANTSPSVGIASDTAGAPESAGALANVETAPTPTPSRSNNTANAAGGAAKSALVAHAANNASGTQNERSEKASTLPEQVSSLDRARVALDSGDSAGALSEIARYRATWPRGVFLTEASVLEIEALAKRGQIVLAGMRAKAFVSAHPDSPQAERLRMLIPRDER
ncbi:MAG TPA: hypothetical protein VGM44_10445 [Polyangiaceae bacterium]|jgi:hypothetical protein